MNGDEVKVSIIAGPIVGTAGEDIEAGDFVTVGENGLILKARPSSCPVYQRRTSRSMAAHPYAPDEVCYVEGGTECLRRALSRAECQRDAEERRAEVAEAERQEVVAEKHAAEGRAARVTRYAIGYLERARGLMKRLEALERPCCGLREDA